MFKLGINYSTYLFCVCETWLIFLIQSSVVNFDGVLCYHNDPIDGIAKHSVGIYAKNSIRVGQVYSEHQNTLALDLFKISVTVLLVYHPTSNSVLDDTLLLSFLPFLCTQTYYFVGPFQPSIY